MAKYRLWSSRETNLLSKYGLTPEAYKALEEAQNHSCKLCRKHKSKCRYGTLDVDHCHKTGEIRGLLCNNCNQGLGYFREDQTALLRAIQYLKRRL